MLALCALLMLDSELITFRLSFTLVFVIAKGCSVKTNVCKMRQNKPLFTFASVLCVLHAGGRGTWLPWK